VGLLSAAELTIDGRSVPHDDVVGDVDLPSFELRVTGQPQGKGRPRFDPARKRTYTPKETKVAEREVRAAWEEVGEPRLPDDQAIAVVVRLVVVRPAGHFKKDGSLSAEGLRHPLPRNKKPDVDNALKLVMDALNSRAYRDDVQIASALVLRQWGELPETRIHVRSIVAL
jgi:Holliday junction resolvase RusA-like endonuclease